MRFANLIKSVVIFLLIMSGHLDAADPKLPEQVIHRRMIDEDRQLVVVRGASVSGEQLKASWPKDSQLPTLGYSVRVEMRTQGGGPLVLGSQMHYEFPDRASEFEVLDSLADAKTVVLAIGTSGSFQMWKMELLGDKREQVTYLRGGEWAPTPDVRPVEKSDLNVRLSWDEQKRVSLEMDHWNGRLTFQQDTREWKFSRVAMTPMDNNGPKGLFTLAAPFGSVQVIARESQRIPPLEGFSESVTDNYYALIPLDILFQTRQQPRMVVATRYVPVMSDSPHSPLDMLAGCLGNGTLAFASLEDGWIRVWQVGLFGEITMFDPILPEWLDSNHGGIMSAKDLNVALKVDDRGYSVTIVDHRLGDDKPMRYVSTRDWKFKREEGPATQPVK